MSSASLTSGEFIMEPILFSGSRLPYSRSFRSGLLCVYRSQQTPLIPLWCFRRRSKWFLRPFRNRLNVQFEFCHNKYVLTVTVYSYANHYYRSFTYLVITCVRILNFLGLFDHRCHFLPRFGSYCVDRYIFEWRIRCTGHVSRYDGTDARARHASPFRRATSLNDMYCGSGTVGM